MKERERWSATKILIQVLEASMRGESCRGEKLTKEYMIYHQARMLVFAELASKEMAGTRK